jgi:predicted aldo/keto reductase-like oxidoreductase
MENNSRRKFLRNATGLVATGLITGSAVGNTLRKLDSAGQKGELIYRNLGRTGIKLPIVSMGVMNSSNPNLVKVAYQSGIRHFDTAWIYQGGNNEKMVGKVLKDLGVSREDVVITTKIVIDRSLKRPTMGAERKKQFIDRFSQSLERLQMDYADMLMMHDVSAVEEVTDPYIMEAMQELKDKGKIRFPAFSTHVYWPELLNAATDKGFYDVVLLSFNYSMFNDNASMEAMKKAAAKGIGLIAMKTQCQQDWYKRELPAETQKFYEGSLMHTALLKWVLRHEFIATSVPGFTTFDQLQADMIVAADLTFTQEETRFLEDQHVQLAIQSVCRFCSGCRVTCPHGVDIPSLMRAHMYAMSYGNMHMTRTVFDAMDKGTGLSVCSGCETCVAQCRNRVQIAQRVEELKQVMG